MDIMEKLIDILRKPIFPHELADPTEAVADYLLDNGVTVQEWIPVKDSLPDSDQEVFLCTREIETYGKHHEKKRIYRNIYRGYFDGEEWLTSYCHGCEYIFRMNEIYPTENIEVTHWMPMPEPPKEDDNAKIH